MVASTSGAPLLRLVSRGLHGVHMVTSDSVGLKLAAAGVLVGALRVVETVSDRSHRREAVVDRLPGEYPRSELGALIARYERARVQTALVDGHAEGVGDEGGGRGAADREIDYSP